ncbi:MAG: tetratricopeptide repeat protein [Gemmatimonadaceae bacterium]
MAPALMSEQDRAVLRTFARRVDPSDAGAHNNLGVLYYNKALYEEAVGAFMRALELDPRMQVAQRNLEIAYFNTGYYDRRVTELTERLRSSPADRDARWELGRTYALLGQLPEASAQFIGILEHHPDDIGALVQLGLAEKAGGDLEKAQRWFERARELDPSSPVIHFYVGEVVYNRGLNDEALNALKRAIELAPDNPEAHYLLGFVLGDMGRHEEARAATKHAVKLNPTLARAQANLSLDRYNPDGYEAKAAGRATRRTPAGMEVAVDGGLAHFNLGLAFRQKGYFTESLREYRLGLDRGEDRELLLQAMAEVHLLKHDPRAAIELYDRLLETQPSSPKLWNERGVALHQEGKLEEAVASYRRAVGADARYAIAHNNLGVGLYHAGDNEGSVGAFRAALDAEPAFTRARLNLALLLYKAKKLQRALEAYRQVISGEPEQPVAWNGIGLVLSDLRKFEDARNAFARAIQARPDYAEAHYNLSFALSNGGDFEGALRETKRALELDPYYVAQKFELAIDLEYEDPDISIVPDLGGAQRSEQQIEEFTFDPALLDSLFTELSTVPTPVDTVAVSEGTAYAMAEDYFSKGLVDRAAAEISRALSRGADRATGLALLGDVFARQGLFGEALERYRESRHEAADGDLPEDNGRAMTGEVRVLLELGRYSEALPAAEALLAARPEDADMLLLAAGARAGSGDPASALRALETARRVAPMRPDVMQRTGDIARSLGDTDAAIAAYHHAIELDPDLAAVRFELARLLIARDRHRDAEQELVAALNAVPTYGDATLELSRLRRRSGRARDALDLLIELLQRDPYHLEALHTLGETLLEAGRDSDAAEAFGRVLRFDPGHAGALYHQGVLLARRHAYREAIALWERVIALDSAGEYSRRARRDARTAADLRHIFGSREAT